MCSLMTKKSKKTYVVKKSSIHRRGLFATVDIPRNEKIVQYLGDLVDKEESEKRAFEREKKARKYGSGLVYIFELNHQYDIDGNVKGNDAKFMNHSCEPNCQAFNVDDQAIWIYSKKNIKKGEELTFDYGYDIENFKDHVCLCNAPSCLGYIVRKNLKHKLKQILKNKK